VNSSNPEMTAGWHFAGPTAGPRRAGVDFTVGAVHCEDQLSRQARQLITFIGAKGFKVLEQLIAVARLQRGR